MAAGFKQATVNASDVPASQTNFPAYVDLSRVGITTLAEAQSVRCYSDSAKTTELAREIVSATEMHVKIPSLTSTFVLYVDYDGVRADYAVSDTYGRNAVWSDYAMVSHMYDVTTSAVQDASGKNTMNKQSAGNPNEVNGFIGKGQDFQTNSDRIALGTNQNHGTFTSQAWFTTNANRTGYANLILKRPSATNGAHVLRLTPTDTLGVADFTIRHGGAWLTILGTTIILTNTSYFVCGTTDGTTMRVYLNGVQEGSGAISGNVANLTATTFLGYDQQTGDDTQGTISEARLRSGALSADWILTEYNNQSDEAGFWGTWTDAGGGAPAFVPRVLIY